MYALEVAREPITLLAERALFIPRFSTLVVADLHFGKSATFRARGVPIPAGVTQHDLERLTHAILATNATRLVVIGDLIHAKDGRSENTFRAISEWRNTHASVEFTLVRGNHDIRAGDPPAEWNFRCADGPMLIGPFALQHHPGIHDTRYVLAGHLHPHATVRGPARQSLRLPCFAFGKRGAILPAFTTFTGGGAYEQNEDDELYVIADSEVLPARPMKRQ
ncbi:MAG: ligase-associated DNA damage response endonuclease PdeM [Gemmatimonadaceae bacterium]